MKIDRVVVGNLEENCYLLFKENKCLIIDPGDEASKIIEKIGDREVIGILVTHDHFDHVGALEEMKQHYNCPIYSFEEGLHEIGPFVIDVIETKGHSKDSVTYYFKEEQVMFVGDFIFEGTIGRCDLPGGNFETMMESIHKIKKYPNVTLYPGHGNETTLNKEKENNPYFQV